MIRRPHVVIAVAAALCCVPAAALASSPRSKSDSASVNCGGSGVDSLYCIPQQSVFAFTHVGKGAHCSIQANFTIEPTIKGLNGHAHVELSGTGSKHNVKRVAHPLVGGGSYSLQFKKLSSGDYKLSGWYEGDGTRLASTHKSKRFALHCS
jgi:hypothetical protein